MNTTPLLLNDYIPRDRAIWLVANIVTPDELGCSAETWQGYAKWSVASQDWLDSRGMSIRCFYEASLHVLEWMELADQAQNCPESETSVNAGVHFWEHRHLSVGYYACFSVHHSPTLVSLVDRTEGPFPTRQQACLRLASMLAANGAEQPQEVAA